MKSFRAAVCAAVVLCAVWQAGSNLWAIQTGGGSVNLSATNVAHTQEFDSLALTGTSSALPTGWLFDETGTSAAVNSLYTAGTGSSNGGDTYSFGAVGSSDRALGALRSGTLTPVRGAAFTNNTGQTITSLDISYTGEQWRFGAVRTPAPVPDRIDFQLGVMATSLTSAGYADIDALDFTSPVFTGPVGPLDGNAPANRAALAATIPGLSIPPGATFWIRWTDFDVVSSDDGLAVDDFSITASGGGLPTLSITDATVMEGNAGAQVATFTVNVSTPAHAGVSFDIATADGTGPDAATAGSGDYVTRTISGQFIPPGVTSFAFDVTINGDTMLEADETFAVNLSNASIAIADAQGSGTIANDDAAPPVITDVVISQVYGGGGNAGATYTHDFVELFNRGTSTVSVTGWTLQYLSSTGTGTWATTPLSGSIPPGGYYLVRQAAGTGGTTPLPAADAVGSIAMAAGAGKVALRSSATAFTGACPLSGINDLAGYGAANCFEGTAPVSALGNTTAAFRKRAGCYDSDNNGIDFSTGNPAPRNSASPVQSCQPVSAPIHEIQGDGPATPYLGQFITTTGVVTARKANGFFLQTPDDAADANPATSQALFVFTAATPAVAVGNAVSIVGTASEFFNLTQVESTLPGDVFIDAPVATVPAATLFTTAILDATGTPDQLERFEAMRMSAASLTSVAPTSEFGEISTVLTGVARPMREPGISVVEPVPPDPMSGMADCCIPRFDANPERLVIDTEGLVGMPVLNVTSNVVLSSVTGPLDFTFGEYKVLPETPLVASADMSGVAVPEPAADEFTVGGSNIIFFSNGETQRKKAALAIRLLMRSPDVIGLIEILNLASLQALAAQVNADTVAAGGTDPQYEAYLIEAPAGGTQNVGFLVKTSRVQVDSVVQEQGTDQFVFGSSTSFLHDRPPLVLRATADPAGLNPRPVIVVVNHTRSFIDVELVGGDGPRVRAKRTAQAEAIAGLLQQLQVDNPGVPVLAIGDYNAYQFNDGYTDPIAILKGTPTPGDQIVVDGSPDLVNPDFVNLTDSLPAAQQYTFIFEGTPQAIDHVLVNAAGLPLVQRYAIAHGNADFPQNGPLGSDATRPERASDHDMPVAYLKFPPPSADLSVSVAADVASVQAGGSVTYTLTVTNGGPSPAQNVVVAHNLPAPPVSLPLLAAGASSAITVVVPTSCEVPDGTLLLTSAGVSSDTADGNAGNNTASTSVLAVNPPPVIGTVAVSRSQLWPANHKMVDVAVNYSLSDSCGGATAGLSVTSSEPAAGTGSGDTAPDWEVVNGNLVRLRAERAGSGPGRTYTITVTATDAAGGTSSSTASVFVPHDQGK